MFKGRHEFNNRNNRNGKGHIKIFPAEENQISMQPESSALIHPNGGS